MHCAGLLTKNFHHPWKWLLLAVVAKRPSTRNRPFVFPPWTEPPGSPRAALTMQMCTICSHYGKPHRNQTARDFKKKNQHQQRPPSGPQRAFWHAIITDFRGSFESAVATEWLALFLTLASRQISVNSCENATFVEGRKTLNLHQPN